MAIKAVPGLLRKLAGYKTGLYHDPGMYSDEAADILKRLDEGEPIYKRERVSSKLKRAHEMDLSPEKFRAMRDRAHEIRTELANQKEREQAADKLKREREKNKGKIKTVKTKTTQVEKPEADEYEVIPSDKQYERQTSRFIKQVEDFRNKELAVLTTRAAKVWKEKSGGSKFVDGQNKEQFIAGYDRKAREEIEARAQRALRGAERPEDLPKEMAEQQQLPLDWRGAGLKDAPPVQYKEFPHPEASYGRPGQALPLSREDSRLLDEQLRRPLARPTGVDKKDKFADVDVVDEGGYTVRTSKSGAQEIQEKMNLAGEPIYGGRLVKNLEKAQGGKTPTKGSTQTPIPGLTRLPAPARTKQGSLLEPQQLDLVDAPTRLRDPNVRGAQPVLDEVAPSPRHETTPRDIPKLSEGRNAQDFFMSSNEYNAIKTALLKNADNPRAYQDLVLFDTLATLGLRSKTASLLRVKDIDIPNKRIIIRPEIAKARTGTKKALGDEHLPLTDELAEELRIHLNNRAADGVLDLEDFIFVNKDGKAFRRLRDPVRKMGQSIGIEGLTPHALRHFSATARALGGATDDAIKNALLHLDEGTAADYYFPKNFRDLLKQYARSRGIDIENMDPRQLAERLRQAGPDVLPDDIYNKLANLPVVTPRSQALKIGQETQGLSELEQKFSYHWPLSQQIRAAAGPQLKDFSPELAQPNVEALTKYYDDLAATPGATTKKLMEGVTHPDTGTVAQLEKMKASESIADLEGDWVIQMQMHFDPQGFDPTGKVRKGGQYKNLAEVSEILPTEVRAEVLQAAGEAITAHGGSVQKILQTAKGREVMKVFVGHLGQREVFRRLSLTLSEKYARIVKKGGTGAAERLTTHPDKAGIAKTKVDQLQQVIKKEPSSPIGGKAGVPGYTGQLIEALAQNNPKKFKEVFDHPRNTKLLKSLGKVTATLLFISSAMQMPEGMVS